MRAAVYTRISDDPTGLRAGVVRQRCDCLALCERQGWDPTVYEDNSVSAFSGRRRPAYEAMCEALRAGAVDIVLAWHPDRFHRSPRELEDFILLVERTRSKVHTVCAGEFDLATPEGRLTARITGSVARKASEDMSRRGKRHQEELAALGKPKGGGRRALGFEGDGTTHRVEEADKLRDAATRLLSGEGLKAVANDLGWGTTTLRRAITAPRMVAQRTYHGDVVGPATWDPILDETTYRALVRLLSDPERVGIGGRTRIGSRLCSGLARCSLCNAKMWLATVRGAVSYRCRECGGTRIKADWVDQLAETSVLTALDGPGMHKAISRQNNGLELEAAKELEAAQSTLIELAGDWGRGALSRAEYSAAKVGADHRRVAAQRRLDGITTAPVLTGISGPIRTAWAEADLSRRRAIVAAVIDHVAVSPALRRGSTTFDRDRLYIAWKL